MEKYSFASWIKNEGMFDYFKGNSLPGTSNVDPRLTVATFQKDDILKTELMERINQQSATTGGTLQIKRKVLLNVKPKSPCMVNMQLDDKWTGWMPGTTDSINTYVELDPTKYLSLRNMVEKSVPNDGYSQQFVHFRWNVPVKIAYTPLNPQEVGEMDKSRQNIIRQSRERNKQQQPQQPIQQPIQQQPEQPLKWDWDT